MTNPNHYDHLGDAKYRHKGYKASVRAWIRKLRYEDGQAGREERRRDFQRGNLATGGKGGLMDGVPIPPAPMPDGHYPEPEERDDFHRRKA